MGNGNIVNLENIGFVDQGILDTRPVKTVIDERSFKEKQSGKFDWAIVIKSIDLFGLYCTFNTGP